MSAKFQLFSVDFSVSDSKSFVNINCQSFPTYVNEFNVLQLLLSFYFLFSCEESLVLMTIVIKSSIKKRKSC